MFEHVYVLDYDDVVAIDRNGKTVNVGSIRLHTYRNDTVEDDRDFGLMCLRVCQNYLRKQGLAIEQYSATHTHGYSYDEWCEARTEQRKSQHQVMSAVKKQVRAVKRSKTAVDVTGLIGGAILFPRRSTNSVFVFFGDKPRFAPEVAEWMAQNEVKATLSHYIPTIDEDEDPAFYTTPIRFSPKNWRDWLFAEFESENDAALFMLRWM